jgi:hypothetical protein
MDNTSSFTSGKSGKSAFVASAILAAAALLFGSQTRAQEPKLTAPYAKAAMQSLLAIESDDSIAQERDSETVAKIDAADDRVATDEEVAVSKTIHTIYSLRLQDNKLMRAYGKLMEIESAPDSSDDTNVQRKKDAAVSQFADVQEAIMKRQEGCFRELEQSLTDRSADESAACSEWIQKAKASHSGNESSISVQFVEPKTDGSHPLNR